MGQHLDTTERARLDSSMRRVYAALLDAGSAGLLNWELVSKTSALDAPRRARELRARGFAVTVEREDGGAWRYRLLRSQSYGAALPASVVDETTRIDGLLQLPLFDGDGDV